MCAGSFAYAAFAAYAHQIQHEWPELVFWMHPPVHTVHHNYEMWKKNFGIGVDVWDKIFGTYERVEWRRDPARARQRWRDFVRIKWL
jgi:sterol desaturase/sphingolipid hydroxylase (fatty acid hydroxylase superfamily)